MRDLSTALRNLREGLRWEYSGEVVDEAKKVLEEAVPELSHSYEGFPPKT